MPSRFGILSLIEEIEVRGRVEQEMLGARHDRIHVFVWVMVQRGDGSVAPDPQVDCVGFASKRLGSEIQLGYIGDQ